MTNEPLTALSPLDNPLIAYFEAKKRGQNPKLPFDTITHEHFVPAMEWARDLALERLDRLKALNNPGFEQVVLALENMGREAELVASLVYTYSTTVASPEISVAKKSVDEMASKLSNTINMDSTLFGFIKHLHDTQDSLGLNPVEARLLDDKYKGFIKSGALLTPVEQRRLIDIDERLNDLATRWTDNHLTSEAAFHVHIESADDLTGVPQTVIDRMHAEAVKRGYETGYVVTEDGSLFTPFMRLCSNRDLREKVSRAMARTAYRDEHDNNDIIIELVKLRHERSNLLGYATTVDYQLDGRMAKTKEDVMAMVDGIGAFAKKRAKAEIDALQNLARKRGQNAPLESWDYAFYADQLKKDYYGSDEEQLKDYLTYDACLQMIFDHQEKLLGVNFVEKTGEYPVHAEGVRVLEAFDKKTGEKLGVIYLDLMERPEKMNGASAAAYDKRIIKRNSNEPALIFIRGSIEPPHGDMPSRLYHDDFIMLAHEVGHAMHSLVSESPYDSLAGTSVEADFVELPSQLNERWFLEYSLLSRYARHWKTGEPLPEDLLNRKVLAQNFGEGVAKMGYLKRVIFDMELHSHATLPSEDVHDLERIWGGDYMLFKDYGQVFSVHMDHLFDMPMCQYVSGYYVYLWADVLSAHAFAAFKEKGLYDPEMAGKFRTLLAAGGTVDPLELYINFRGEKADPMALVHELDLDKTTIQPLNDNSPKQIAVARPRPSSS